MNEITCPHCDQVFEMDAAGYAEIQKQVRGAEFETELHARLKDAEEKHKMAVQLAESQMAEQKNLEFLNKEKQIERLKSELTSAETKSQLAINDAVNPLKMEITTLGHKIESAESERTLLEKSLEDKYKTQIQDRESEIDRLRDFKAKLSTKMLGESLELHCENQFNTLRSIAFPNAYFEKDNDASAGSKGDYVFREADSNGTEFISIMFEMKNEGDTTATKKKNEDFLEKLDKDRRNKKCEFGILVSVLEADNDLYNNGIVDKSHRFPNMYVVRPQFFIPIITLLRNAAMKSLQVRNELALVKEQNIDITNFEEDLASVQSGFAKNYDTAKKQFEEAIKSIDNSISDLNKVKDKLLRSGNNYRLANDKIQNVSVKKLTRQNPTMKDKFDELNEYDADQ
ncbi:DUF2130 domain-containing protein [Euryarchaeota archaeon]|jgi:hypothetical protein|nr:DUF2130 domain-containing protein [Euryarchaeota archaeon]MDB9834920.1 DUF2130 domain-containing protein [Candidatus Poseidoniaceae archaeon]